VLGSGCGVGEGKVVDRDVFWVGGDGESQLCKMEKVGVG